MDSQTELTPEQRLAARELAERFAVMSLTPGAIAGDLDAQVERELLALTAGMEAPRQAAFVEAFTNEIRMLRAESKKDPNAFQRRLASAESHSSPVRSGRVGEEIVRTAVRATVWESVRALFRLFR